MFRLVLLEMTILYLPKKTNNWIYVMCFFLNSVFTKNIYENTELLQSKYGKNDNSFAIIPVPSGMLSIICTDDFYFSRQRR